MTRIRRDANDTPFSDWLRCHPELHSVKRAFTANDLDYVVHAYRTPCDRLGTRQVQHIMILEVKSMGADMTDAQRDTFDILDQILRNTVNSPRKKADGIPARKCRSLIANGNVTVRIYGCHKLQMSGSRPDSSRWLVWDKRQIDEPTLLKLLRFELHPDTLAPLSDRRHHALSKPRDRMLFRKDQ